MNIIGTLKTAIEYMEDNLYHNISNEDVAKNVYMSPYHFHRTFSMITELSVKEYLLSRRMSLAGQDLVLTDIKVIDIAYKYCYQTPESFTKAFVRFHGITPKAARKAGGGLKMFNRLQLKLITEGGQSMVYRIEKTSPFQVLTKVKAFSGDVVEDDNNQEIPDFWKTSVEDGTFKDLSKHATDQSVYGLCSPVDKTSNSFKYGIGKLIEDNKEDKNALIKKGYEIWSLNNPLWAVFSCIGQTPDCIGETWSRIFKEFLPGSEYDFLEDIDFEYYPTDGEEDVFCEIWIPIGKKK